MVKVIHVSDMKNYSNSIYIGRANGRYRLNASPLANPFPIRKTLPRQSSIARYVLWFVERLHEGDPVFMDALIACRDKPIACWCRRDCEEWSPESACHGDVIYEYLDRFTDDQLRAIATTPE